MPESEISVLTPMLCMNGRESPDCTFWVGLASPDEHAMEQSSTNKHPNPKRGGMRIRLLLFLKLSVSMNRLLNLELHEPALVESNAEIQYKIVFRNQIL